MHRYIVWKILYSFLVILNGNRVGPRKFCIWCSGCKQRRLWGSHGVLGNSIFVPVTSSKVPCHVVVHIGQGNNLIADVCFYITWSRFSFGEANKWQPRELGLTHAGDVWPTHYERVTLSLEIPSCGRFWTADQLSLFYSPLSLFFVLFLENN